MDLIYPAGGPGPRLAAARSAALRFAAELPLIWRQSHGNHGDARSYEWTGATVAYMLGQDPESQIEDDLRRFKQLMETGEVATSYTPASERVTWTNR